MPTKTIAYLRVSTDKQADRGVSLDAQRAKLKAYAELYELDLVDVIVDAGQSAKSLDRPGLQRALGMLKAGEAEALLVVKLDRLTRSVVDLGTLVERYFAPGKAALLSVGEQIDTRSAAGRLVLNVLASVSQSTKRTTTTRISPCAAAGQTAAALCTPSCAARVHLRDKMRVAPHGSFASLEAEERADHGERMQKQRSEPSLEAGRFGEDADLPQHCDAVVVNALAGEAVIGMEAVDGAEWEVEAAAGGGEPTPGARVRAG